MILVDGRLLSNCMYNKQRQACVPVKQTLSNNNSCELGLMANTTENETSKASSFSLVCFFSLMAYQPSRII